DTVRNSLDCDSIIYTLNLTVLSDVVIKDAESDKVCYNTDYTWVLPEGNRTIAGYTEAGLKTIYDTVRNSLDCDSIIYTLNLTVWPDVDIKDAESDKVCYNTDYTWVLPEGNRTIDGYTVAGVKTIYDTVRNSLDCDSIIYTLNLTVLPDVVIKDAESDKVCYNTDYTWALPEGNRTIDGYTVAGVKTIYDTVRNSLDCDSIIYTLNLTVLPDVVIKDAESDKVCYNTDYTWVLPEGNRTIDGYTVAGVKTIYDTVRNSLDCDSIIYTLNLTVWPDVVIKDVESDKVCYNTKYTWALPEGNRTIDGYTVAGVKTIYDTVRNSLDCDSIIYTLNLTVWPATVDEPTKYDTILVDNLPYIWSTYTDKTIACYTADTYRDTAFNILGCDSIRYTLELAIIAHDTVTKEIELDLCHGESYTSRKQTVTPYLVGDTTFSDIVPSIMMEPLLMRDSVYAYTIHVQSRYVDELPALVKYDSWLLVVDRKGIEDKGITFTADQVLWYRVEDEVDEYPFGENNDTQIGTGDYYTIAEKMSGQYYALIDVDVSWLAPCATIARTVILDCDAPSGSGPKLTPTIVQAGGLMTLSNLSEGESDITVYSASGQLIRTEKVINQTEHEMHAEGITGVYLLQVTNKERNDVFKYVITH
ncbi:MAG: T9SS type A sorting domain-containing protein, partial [Paludibacteraceae bacterium]|nr:T9SS type A sorting domain-containing protein [Paludibacteraceae bacterium]